MALSAQILPLTWYWGETRGTQVTSVVPRDLTWLMRGIHTAGPRLTPKTFQQGLFSIPASGGAAQNYPTGALVGYGKNPGLPYDEYMDLSLDFVPVWWDPETTGPSNGTGTVGKGVITFVNGAKRYRAARGRPSRSPGSRRRAPSSVSTRGRRRHRSTWVTAPTAPRVVGRVNPAPPTAAASSPRPTATSPARNH